MKADRFELHPPVTAEVPPPEPCIIVIFGASGDLTHRELIPALYSLGCKGLLPQPYAIIGFARREWQDDDFRKKMHEALQHRSDFRQEKWEEFSRHLFYVSGNFNDEPDGAYGQLYEKIQSLRKEMGIPDNILFHLAVAPEFYGTIVKRLQPASLSQSENGWRRVIVEKPFGHDRASALRLDKEIHEIFDEDQIFRVDHFLGKETVQNMLVFRFANPGFEPIWNRNYIDNVQITVAEDIGIEKRGNFYEKTGVVRDMVQNHLLQLLCMATIEPPVNFDADSLHTETIKVLKSICPINPRKDFIPGQYGSGKMNGHEVPAYREEENVAPDSMTPTYAALSLYIDNWRWADVPFFLRTGKRMGLKMTEVTIQFKPTPHLMFPVNKRENMHRNILRFRLQPNEGIIYTFMAKQPGAELLLRPVSLDFRYDAAFGIKEPPSAYQWLLHDVMKGDQVLFPVAEWIYEAWEILDPLIKQWENEPWLKFPNYTAGSRGPKEADRLIQETGREWYEV